MADAIQQAIQLATLALNKALSEGHHFTPTFARQAVAHTAARAYTNPYRLARLVSQSDKRMVVQVGKNLEWVPA